MFSLFFHKKPRIINAKRVENAFIALLTNSHTVEEEGNDCHIKRGKRGE